MKNTIELKESFKYDFSFYASTSKSEYGRGKTLENAIKDACEGLELQGADSHYIILCNRRGEMSIQSCHVDDYAAFMEETALVYSSIKLVGGYNLGGDMDTYIF